MTRDSRSEPGKSPKSTRARTRADRLKAALKANMARRKAQGRARETKAGETGPGKE